jgi:hypothetical protein
MRIRKLLRHLWRDIRLALLRRRGLRYGRDCRFIEPLPHFMNEPYLVTIGNHCTVSSAVSLITHDGGTWLFRDEPEYKDLKYYGKIEIRDNCFIGARAIILPGVTIGPNAVVGAGSIVTKDVAPNTIVAGNPARFICTMDQYKEKMLQKGVRLPVRTRAELRQKLDAMFSQVDADKMLQTIFHDQVDGKIDGFRH